jgi:hypothetical protein
LTLSLLDEGCYNLLTLILLDEVATIVWL